MPMAGTATSPYPKIRGTDKAFFQLMQLCGSAMLKLFGFAPDVAENYTFRAIELKKSGKPEKRPDIEAIPTLESENTRALIEFQGYADKLIRYRSLGNMIQACTTGQPRKAVMGIIVYTASEYKKAALDINALLPDLPATNPLREVVLTDYNEPQLLAVDSRLTLLAPFTVPENVDRRFLAQKSLQWTRQIQTAFTEAEAQAEALDIIGLFIFHRFRFLNRQEVNEMLNLDLMRSRAVQEVYHEGLEKGREEGREEGREAGREEERKKATQQLLDNMLAVLNSRFGEVPSNIQTLMMSFQQFEDCMDLHTAASNCKSLEAFEAYCQARKAHLQ